MTRARPRIPVFSTPPLTAELLDRPFETIRERAAWVAERATQVRIDPEAVAAAAAALPRAEVIDAGSALLPEIGGDPEAVCAFVISLDAVNFGSGYFPLLAKLPGASGYRTIEARLLAHVAHSGPLRASALASIDATDCARIFGQDLAVGPIAELMELFALSLRDLGATVRDRFEGEFVRLVRQAAGSAGRLVRSLVEMPLYRDAAAYHGRQIPFLKRAQITVSDLARALSGNLGPSRDRGPSGDLGHFDDLDDLTIFADNLVPHVLRVDGVLHFDDALLARIQAGTLLRPGSPEEVEIRACGVHAVELIAAHMDGIRPRQLDDFLWLRGGRPEYKAHPRHRTRCPFY